MLNLKLIKTLESNCGSIYSMVQHGNLLFWYAYYYTTLHHTHTNISYDPSATYENTINIFDMRTWECERLLTGHTGSVYGLVIHGNKLYSSSYDTSIRVRIVHIWLNQFLFLKTATKFELLSVANARFLIK
jgi:WD40 repeat protein